MVLGGELSGVASVWRNHGPTQTGVLGVPRPAFIVLDGGTKLTQDVRMHKAQRMPPTIWNMSPQVMIVLENRDTVENNMLDGVYSPVGPELSSWATKINSLITNDNVLLDLITTNGTLFLQAVETDLKLGRTIGAYGAWLMMLYEFYYPVFPSR
jgi:hypothetical protein